MGMNIDLQAYGASLIWIKALGLEWWQFLKLEQEH